MHQQFSNIHPLAYILSTCALIFSSSSLFTVYPTAHVTASHHSSGDNPPERGKAVRKNTGPSKTQSTYVPGLSLLPIFHAAFTFIPLLPKSTVTRSVQPNLNLPRTRPPFIIIIIIIIVCFCQASLRPFRLCHFGKK